jgi:hypothetical protein
VLTGVLAYGTCWLSAADDAPASGLKGILPNAVPVELTATIAQLPENWKDWGDALSKELSNLYESETSDAASQRQAIAALRTRLAAVNRYAADSRFRAILNQLVSLSGGLKRRLDVAEAALETLERGPEIRAARVDAARKEVARQSQVLDSYLGSIKNGSGWAKYLQVSEVRGALADGDADKSASALSATQSRLKERDHLADAQARDFLARPQFAEYERAVDAYLAALKAPAAPANSPELRKSLADLLGALEQYETDHSTAASTAARKALDGVRANSPDGGERMLAALRSNYLNYNLRIAASEAFLNKFVAQTQQETGPVRDFILGADVYGNQVTNTSVGINLVPAGNMAQFEIVANGFVNSNTSGYTDRATIFTQGNHHFIASKGVAFDGERFWTQPARISVNPNNMTTGADVNMRLPLFHGLADRIAVRKAEEQRGESEAIAASRVQDKVLPKFNAEVDQQFGPGGKSNSQLAEKMANLKELGLFPDAKSWSTTDSELRGAARLMEASELGGSDPNPALFLGRGISLLLHQTMINNAIDRLDFAGKTMTDDEIRAKIEQQISTLLGREWKFSNEPTPVSEPAAVSEPKPETEGEGEPLPRTLVFDKNDPIRADVGDGALVITIRAGFKQEGKEDIPTQVITIPLRFSVDMKNVVINRDRISIAAAEGGGGARQLASAGVIRRKMSQAFPEQREINRVRYVEREQRRVQAAVTRIRALDGWLSVSFE